MSAKARPRSLSDDRPVGEAIVGSADSATCLMEYGRRRDRAGGGEGQTRVGSGGGEMGEFG